ncbi:hypothetical protein H072_6857 [Dactylellina haptotyla CBS 200.50]|uniref:Extracellular membrane protein CFEM domain-containing protein n=1 Tax=Dactylellina haptotyla (strain CBS 200.50) TaxID=1284197 RepID=S8AE61_DACHA|nr:hypothetical protein H072_6857 [Dactylellina haptotyla CBS 200.50]
MSPRSLNLILASSVLLAGYANAQYTLPEACNTVIKGSDTCGATKLSANSATADLEAFYKCFCLDKSLPTALKDCLTSLDMTQTLAQSTAQALEAVNQFCASQPGGSGGGSSGGSSSASVSGASVSGASVSIAANSATSGAANSAGSLITSALPSTTSGPPVEPSKQCDILASSLQQCGATAEDQITAANVASCLCSGNLAGLATDCVGYFSTVQPDAVAQIGIFTQDYCGKFAPGVNAAAATSAGGSNNGASQTQAGGATNTGTGSTAKSSPAAASNIQIAMGSTLFCVFGIFAMFL